MLSGLTLPTITEPVRLNDLPSLLAPYAVAAPIFVYLLASGHLLACRMRGNKSAEDDLILVLRPHRKLLHGE